MQVSELQLRQQQPSFTTVHGFRIPDGSLPARVRVSASSVEVEVDPGPNPGRFVLPMCRTLVVIPYWLGPGHPHRVLLAVGGTREAIVLEAKTSVPGHVLHAVVKTTQNPDDRLKVPSGLS